MNVTNEEFAAFVKRIHSGDEQAARDLIKEFEPEVRRAARVRLTDSRLRRLVDSIDICQSVFGRFFKGVSAGDFELDSSDQLLAVLTTMTRNRIIDLHRAQSAQKRRPTEAGQPGFVPDPGELADELSGPRSNAIAREQLEQVRSRLDEDEARLVEIRTGGSSWQEVASELGESEEVVRKRFERLIKRVRSEVSLSEPE